MPVSFVDRLPLPNLKVYSAGSVLLLSVAVYYAVNVTSDPNWRGNMTAEAEAPDPPSSTPPAGDSARNVSRHLAEVITFMVQEPLCMWTLINLAYCSLAVFGFVVQRAVFGQLRVPEAQRVKDKLWNYVFYKFIFVFGVINVQYMDEVLLWCSWFTLLGFLHIFAHLARDRFDYLSSVANATTWAHVRLALLLGGILVSAAALLGAACALAPSRDTLLFMAAECVLVALAALHGAARYALAWAAAEPGAPLAHYTRLGFECGSLVAELAHVVHMVAYSNMLVSMASLVLLMQLRQLAHELQARLARHRRWRARSRHLARSCPPASPEEVSRHRDKCAICWEPMREARRLPCAHLFHSGCLCRWVQHDASCPTCRRALQPPPPPAHQHPRPHPHRHNPHSDHLFHFDGSRYVSWLPSFSVEVTRVRPPPPPPAEPPTALQLYTTQDSETETMVEEPAESPPPVASALATTSTPSVARPLTVSVAVDTLEEFSEDTWQFEGSPRDREAQLEARKRRLVAAARARYLAKRHSSTSAPCS